MTANLTVAGAIATIWLDDAQAPAQARKGNVAFLTCSNVTCDNQITEERAFAAVSRGNPRPLYCSQQCGMRMVWRRRRERRKAAGLPPAPAGRKKESPKTKPPKKAKTKA